MARASFTDVAGRSREIYITRGTTINEVFQDVDGWDIEGIDGEDTIFAVGNLDDLRNHPTDDRIVAGAGYDTILAGSGNDTVFSGDGDDRVDGDGGRIGSNFEFSETFSGVGNDLIDGGVGNDTLMGGAGSDTLTGGVGDDRIGGADFVIYDAGNTQVPDSPDLYLGGAGNDTIDVLDKDTARGGADDDAFYGFILEDDDPNARMLVDGGAGNDDFSLRIFGDSNVTFKFGDTRLGNIEFVSIETISSLQFLGDGDDRITGDDARNILALGGGSDVAGLGGGDDFVSKTQGAAKITLGAGKDIASIGPLTTGSIDLGADDDTFISFTLSATPLDERPGTLTVVGGAGADTFTLATPGRYLIRPGADADVILTTTSYTPFNDLTIRPDDERKITIDYSDAKTVGVLVDLAAGTATGGSGRDLIPLVDDVIGSKFADMIAGDDTDNKMDGGSAGDALTGLGGDDTLVGGKGFDTLEGGDGKDALTGGDQNDALDGGDGKDTLSGGTGDDSIEGGTGADRLIAGEGDDTLAGGEGEDIVDGGDGTDLVNYVLEDGTRGVKIFLAGKKSFDSFGDKETLKNVENIRGSLFDDQIYGDDGANAFNGSAGDDTLNGLGGDDLVSGGAGDDVLGGGFDNDTLNGEGDDDKLDGGAGDDNLSGSFGADRLLGDKGADLLDGGDDDDRLDGGAGDDTIAGGDGHDLISDLETGKLVTISGESALEGAGNDIDGGDGADTISGIGLLEGGGDNDQITGLGYLSGGGGNDLLTVIRVSGLSSFGVILTGGAGADTLDGRADLNEYADYGYVGVTGVKIDLDAGTAVAGRGDRDVLRGIQDVRGSIGADTLLGSSDDNALFGFEGSDRIDGLADNDFLYGGDDNDTIHGGTGNDRVEGGDGDDRIFGDSGKDTLDGGEGNDIITVGAGVRNRNDVIPPSDAFGQAGEDILIAAAGSYCGLAGGAGSDDFYIERGASFVQISDFDARSEQIDLSDFGIAGFGALKALAVGTGASGTTFELNSKTSFAVIGMTLSDFSANDFVL